MAERFTKQARRVVEAAVEESRRLGSETIEPEHLVLGVLSTGPNGGEAALRAEGVDADALRAAMAELPDLALASVGIAAEDVRSSHGLRGRARTLRWGASRPADGPGEQGRAAPHAADRRRRGDRRIGPEHLLLALLDARAGHASRLLSAAGSDPDAVAARLAS
jgi:ATP-dependent Clp protease ATP-binding subunit ClpA